jgi:hypothetical protein
MLSRMRQMVAMVVPVTEMLVVFAKTKIQKRNRRKMGGISRPCVRKVADRGRLSG